MEKDFTIDKVSWHTQRVRNYEFDNNLVYAYFMGLINYLQDRNLTTRYILKQGEEITEETKILATDLTPEGFELIKKGLDRWTDNIFDRGKSPNDYTLLDKHLKKIRSKK